MAAQVLRTLGQRIVAARLAQLPRRMSQRDLARLIGISSKSLNQIESGETNDPKSSIIRKISEVLGVSTDWLLKGDQSEGNRMQKEEHEEEKDKAA
jgi:transcriptional regulator with XRE-family HTH domain